MLSLLKALDFIVPPLVILLTESVLGGDRRVVFELDAPRVELSLLTLSPTLENRRSETELLPLFSILDCRQGLCSVIECKLCDSE